MQANAAQMTGVIAALRRGGIAARTSRPRGSTSMPQYVYEEGQPPRLTGYQASNQVTVTVRDLARLGAAVDAAVTAGANQVGGISFGLPIPQAAENAAREEAVQGAGRPRPTSTPGLPATVWCGWSRSAKAAATRRRNPGADGAMAARGMAADTRSRPENCSPRRRRRRLRAGPLARARSRRPAGRRDVLGHQPARQGAIAFHHRRPDQVVVGDGAGRPADTARAVGGAVAAELAGLAVLGGGLQEVADGALAGTVTGRQRSRAGGVGVVAPDHLARALAADQHAGLRAADRVGYRLVQLVGVDALGQPRTAGRERQRQQHQRHGRQGRRRRRCRGAGHQAAFFISFLRRAARRSGRSCGPPRPAAAVGDDDHLVALLHQARGGAVDADHPRAARRLDGVGGEPGAGRDVEHVDLFVRQDA